LNKDAVTNLRPSATPVAAGSTQYLKYIVFGDVRM
jgi:hypothetical protein